MYRITFAAMGLGYVDEIRCHPQEQVIPTTYLCYQFVISGVFLPTENASSPTSPGRTTLAPLG